MVVQKETSEIRDLKAEIRELKAEELDEVTGGAPSGFLGRILAGIAARQRLEQAVQGGCSCEL